MSKKNLKSKIASFLSLSIVIGMLPISSLTVSAITDTTAEAFNTIVGTYSINDEIPAYHDYLEKYTKTYPTTEYRITATDYVRYEEDGVAVTPDILENYENVPGGGSSLYASEEALVEFEVEIKESGFYDVSLLYYPVEGKSSAIQRAFFVDGELPYNEMALIEFHRVWVNNVSETIIDVNGIEVKKWQTDNQGNDLKPQSIESAEWTTRYLFDNNGYINAPLSIYLEKGSHTISMLSLREPMLLHEIVLSNTEKAKPYNVVKSNWDAEGKAAATGINIRIEAENAIKTSSQMLYPRQDQSSPSVYPASPKVLLNNTIGGNSWNKAGQWIEWEFEVPENGYYSISTFCKQNFVRGIDVSRKIYIDGEVPFEELNAYGFSYEQNWREEILSDNVGTPYEFYLEAGKHTLRMEVVLGDMANIISKVQETVQKLNAIYRSVIYITGVAPDKYRDYQIEANLPGLQAQLEDAREGISEALEAMKLTAGKNSDKLTVLITMMDQLDELIKDQERFTEVISSFKVNVRACGNWITQVLGQPLQLDRINIYATNSQEKIEKDNWFAKAAYEIKRLYYSFVIDYNQIGNRSE